MPPSKPRSKIRAAIGDKSSERLVKLEVSLSNITETLSWHITSCDASFKSLSAQIESLQTSITELLLKNAVEEGEKKAMEKMARSAGALSGGLIAGAISLVLALIDHLTR